jgi:hypothetical protein
VVWEGSYHAPSSPEAKRDAGEKGASPPPPRAKIVVDHRLSPKLIIS